MEDKITLTEAVSDELLDFEVDGKKFYLRKPGTDEYDDAMALQRLVYQKTLSRADIVDVADTPCTEGEKLMFEAVIQTTKEQFDAAEDGPAKQALAEELASLQTRLEERTLAVEMASDTASLKRDRWLCARLICDASGKSLFDMKAKDFAKRWDKFPISVKDASRTAIWRALTAVREAPFSLDL